MEIQIIFNDTNSIPLRFIYIYYFYFLLIRLNDKRLMINVGSRPTTNSMYVAKIFMFLEKNKHH